MTPHVYIRERQTLRAPPEKRDFKRVLCKVEGNPIAAKTISSECQIKIGPIVEDISGTIETFNLDVRYEVVVSKIMLRYPVFTFQIFKRLCSRIAQW